MFERYTEMARRTIFFARYEASQFGGPYIETECLLLGLLREDKRLANRMWTGAEIEAVRKQIASQAPARQKLSTSVDMPLSAESKLALAYAAEESEALQHAVIDSAHMVLGLLRLATCSASAILRQHGIEYASLREVLRAAPPPSPVSGFAGLWTARLAELRKAEAPSLQHAPIRLEELLDSVKHFHAHSDAFGDEKLKREHWTRKQALGHLVDLATTHHNLFVRAMTEPRIAANAYPGAGWVAAQQYESYSWPDLVDLWVYLNRLLIHVLTVIPEDKVNTPCRIGIDQPVTLLQLIDRYLDRLENILGQILGRL